MTVRALADPAHPYWRAPRDRWLGPALGRALHQPYPCMCRGTRPCGAHCPCNGRTDDPASLPKVCCARRAAETAQRHQEATAG